MEKMDKNIAEKLYKATKDKWEETTTHTFKIGEEDEVTTTVMTCIPAGDIQNIVDLVTIASFMRGERDLVAEKTYLARCIIEYLTDIPTPQIESENEDGEVELIDDLNVCFELVFGAGGLWRNQGFAQLYNDLAGIISSQCAQISDTKTPVNFLAEKILDLYQISKHEISKILDDPDTFINNVLNVVENK
ncbi:hypothetical protein M2140_000152 [Clostridiales Family XIII bacterium PM5-7]